MTIDASRESLSPISFYFSGIAVLTGGQGNDLFSSQTTLDASDHLDGQGGHDILLLGTSQQQSYSLDASEVRNIEELRFTAFNCSVTTADDLVAKGQSLSVNAAGAGALDFDGSAETNGTFTMTGSDFNDVLTGGAKADSIDAGEGDNALTGGGGADTLSAGSGADDFVYLSAADSTRHATDLITGLDSNDTIDLSAIDADATQAGDQAFQLVASFTGVAGQLTLVYNAGHDVTVLSGDVDGDGKADLVIDIAGDQHSFGGLVL